MAKGTMGGIMYSTFGGDYASGSFIIRQHLNIHVAAGAASAQTPIGAGQQAIVSCTGYVYMGVNKAADNTSIILPPGMTSIGFPEKTDKVSFLGVDGNACEVCLIFPGAN